MSKRPPNDEDAILESILEQVKDAFSESPIADDADDADELQTELMKGVRNSMRALMGMMNDEDIELTVLDGDLSAFASDKDDVLLDVRNSIHGLMGMMAEERTGPSVTVVDGGRADDEPPTEGPRPNLRVAELEESPAQNQESEGGEAQPKVHVRVLNSDDLFLASGPKSQAKTPNGVIHLEKKDEEQWVFFGNIPQRYRIHCQEGSILVAIEENKLLLNSGQSLDVKGKHIRVICQTPTGADGSFYHLPD